MNGLELEFSQAIGYGPRVDPKLPSGLYDQVVTTGLVEQLKAIDPRLVLREGLDEGDADALLARHVHSLVWRVLKGVRARSEAGEHLSLKPRHKSQKAGMVFTAQRQLWRASEAQQRVT